MIYLLTSKGSLLNTLSVSQFSQNKKRVTQKATFSRKDISINCIYFSTLDLHFCHAVLTWNNENSKQCLFKIEFFLQFQITFSLEVTRELSMRRFKSRYLSQNTPEDCYIFSTYRSIFRAGALQSCSLGFLTS